MNIVQAPRASAILYNLLKGRDDARPWLLPANICPIVPITFIKAGVPFNLVDISAETLHMDLEQAVSEVKRRAVGGILYAHTYGEASTPQEFFQHVKQMDESVMIVDDRCLCVPDVQVEMESAADVRLFSTGYAKLVDLGQGGYAFLKDEVAYRSFSLAFNTQAHDQIEEAYKQALRDQVVFEYRDCDWLQTDGLLTPWTVYVEQIKAGLAETLQYRTRLNQIYADRLPIELQLPTGYQTWRFNLRVANKMRILEAIFQAGLFASSHYASLAGIMAGVRCPEAEKLHASVINLFNDHHFDDEKAERICEVILKGLSGNSTLGENA